jgi:large subunit ribosomal protein L24
MHIRVNDTVKILTGDDRDVTSRVLSVDRVAGKVYVEGVNRVYKHVRKSQRNPQGGRLSKEMPVQLSNVMLVCERCKKPTRVGVRITDRGVKERFCKKCSAGIGEIGKAKPSRAASK